MKGAKTIKLGQSGVRLFVQVFGGSIVGLGGERHVRVKKMRADSLKPSSGICPHGVVDD
jgi:hypothetical protein